MPSVWAGCVYVMSRTSHSTSSVVSRRHKNIKNYFIDKAIE